MTLKDEIIAKCPPAMLAARDDGAIAAFISTGRTHVEGINRSDFAVWAASNGVRAVIEDTAVNTSDPLRSTALTLLDFLRGGVAQSLDMASTANQSMLNAWVAMGKITSAQKDELIAMATVPYPVDAWEVTRALEGM